MGGGVYGSCVMAINVENQEAERLLGEIQAATHQGRSEIVLRLLRREAGRLRRLAEMDERRARIEALSSRYAARLNEPPESPEAIIGYDEHGLPR
jgi:antitoxin VapB